MTPLQKKVLSSLVKGEALLVKVGGRYWLVYMNGLHRSLQPCTVGAIWSELHLIRSERIGCTLVTYWTVPFEKKRMYTTIEWLVAHQR